MRHRILTCRNHPNLRWSCKEVAWTERPDGSSYYNGSRTLFFNGAPTGRGMYVDGSGLDCDHSTPECPCDASSLVLAPEDALVRT